MTDPVIPKYLPVPPGTVPAQNAAPCQLCGKPAIELRPFGPNAESICEDCSKLDPETTDKRWRGPHHDHSHG